MSDRNRRSILATGAALAVGSGAASMGAGRDDSSEDEKRDDAGEPGSPDVARPTEVAWRYDGPYIDSRTVATDGRVYTQAYGGVYALDAEDGAQEWQTGDISASGTPVVENDTLYVPGEPIRAVDAGTGDVRWESEIESAELAAGRGMVYASADDTVYALDRDDGSVQWKRERVDAETGDGEVTVDELAMGDVGADAVYAVGPNPDAQGSVIAALDPATGDATAAVTYRVELSAITADSGYVAGYGLGDETAVVFDVSSGEELLRAGTYAYSMTGGAVFANGRYEFTVYDLSEGGAEAWSIDSYYAHSSPVVIGETVVAAHGPGRPGSAERIVAYDLETGTEQWEYALEGDEWTSGAIETSIAVDGDTVYVERDGAVLALRNEDDREESADGSDADGSEDDDAEDDDSTAEDDSSADDTDGERTEPDGTDGDGRESDETASEDADAGDGDPDPVGDESENGTDVETVDDDTDGGDDSSTGGDDDGGTDGSTGDENETTDDTGTDGVPGFTSGAGILGGVLGLEWARRRRTADDPGE